MYDKDNKQINFLNVSRGKMVNIVSGYPINVVILVPENANYILFENTIATGGNITSIDVVK